MVDYDPQKLLYTVKLIDSYNQKLNNQTGHYFVPRIRLMFLAENPNVFVARVKEAYEARKKTEAQLR